MKRCKGFKKVRGHLFSNIKRIHPLRTKILNYAIKWCPPEEQEENPLMIATCEEPSAPDRTITIDPRLCEKDLLRALIDEGIHASYWRLNNEAVQVIASNVAELLSNVGFRLPNGK